MGNASNKGCDRASARAGVSDRAGGCIPPHKRIRGLDQFRRTVLEYPLVCLAVGLYWTWQISFFQSTAAPIARSDFLFPQCVLLAAGIVTYGVACVARSWFAKAASHSGYLVLLALGMAASTLGVSSMGADILARDVTPVVGFVSSGAMGLFSALFIVELGRIFSQLGTAFALSCGIVGTIVGTVLFGLASLLPNAWRDCLICALPLAFIGVFAVSKKRCMTPRFYSWGLDKHLKTPRKLLLTSAAQGLGLGLMTSLFASSSSDSGLAVQAAAFLIGSFLLFATATWMHLDFNHLMYQIGFPLMGLGFLANATLPGDLYVGPFLFSVAHCFVYTIMTCINAHFTHDLKCAPGWIVSLTTLALMAGQLLGILAGMVAPAALPLSEVVAFVMPTVALLFVSGSNMISGWGAIAPSERPSNDEALFSQIASEYRLTPRELEVTQLLARGRNKRHISQGLNLSEETVKTHMGNIYRKLFVHTQQELIDLIEKERLSMLEG